MAVDTERPRQAALRDAEPRPSVRSPSVRGCGVLRRWRFPLVLAVLLVLLEACGLRGALEYRRAAIEDGELWRLLTGSFVHLGWRHLARDLAGLALMWGLFAGRLSEREWLRIMTCSALGVGLGLLAFNQDIAWYVGISGVLFGMFCAGALAEWRTRPRYAGALLLGMAGLIAWTMIAGALPWETLHLGGRVVPQAHLYGAAGGAVAALAWDRRLAGRVRA